MAIDTTYVDDWKSWEQREDITLRVQTAVETYTEYTITASGGGAKRRAINKKEMRESRGVYTGREMVWLIPNQNMPMAVTAPRPGDIVKPANGDQFRVLEVRTGRWGTTHRCVTLLLGLDSLLDATATISRPGLDRSAAGRQALTSYTALYTDIPCKIQPMDSMAEEIDGRMTIPKRYLAFFSQQLGEIRRKDKVVSGGVTYTVMGYKYPESITEFMQLVLEVVE